jgi:hypothetical protein
MLLNWISEWRFVSEPVAGIYPRGTMALDGRGGNDRIAIAAKSASQLALDLAVDALELGGKIPHQHLQTPLAVIDDAPQFGALSVREALIGKPDPGLYDLATPRLRPRIDEFDCPRHALIPGVPHLVRECHSRVEVSGGFAAWLMSVAWLAHIRSKGRRRLARP